MRSVLRTPHAHNSRLRTTLLALVITIAGAAFAPAAQAGTVDTTAAERARAATVAVGKVGSPYRWGATGPDRFDCSGLAVFGFNRANSPLGVRTSQQMWDIGAHIRRSALQRGDLVFTWDSSHGHVGIYIGNGRYVHAPGSGRTVQRAMLPTGSAFVGAVRP